MLSLLMKFSSIKIHPDSVVELYTQQVAISHFRQRWKSLFTIYIDEKYRHSLIAPQVVRKLKVLCK